MKVNNVPKGTHGRIRFLKRKNLLLALILFFIAIALFFIGIAIFQNRGNVFTVIAALFVIPAARALTGFVLVFPFKEVSEEYIAEVDGAVRPGSIIYTDVVLTSTERAMGLAFIVVTGSKVIAVTGRDKEDVFKVQEYLGGMVRRKGFEYKVTIVGEKSKFLSLLKMSDSASEMTFENEEDRKYFENDREELCRLLESVML